jgi:hypothetical protein
MRSSIAAKCNVFSLREMEEGGNYLHEGKAAVKAPDIGSSYEYDVR